MANFDFGEVSLRLLLPIAALPGTLGTPAAGSLFDRLRLAFRVERPHVWGFLYRYGRWLSGSLQGGETTDIRNTSRHEPLENSISGGHYLSRRSIS
jgi:hypothetical protein